MRKRNEVKRKKGKKKRNEPNVTQDKLNICTLTTDVRNTCVLLIKEEKHNIERIPEFKFKIKQNKNKS